jgi:hypothetical protein
VKKTDHNKLASQRRVEDAAVRVENQHQLIYTLERGGHDTSDARGLLKEFEKSLEEQREVLRSVEQQAENDRGI